jgi:hypothetical protein
MYFKLHKLINKQKLLKKQKKPQNNIPFVTYYGKYALCTNAKCSVKNGMLLCNCDVKNGLAIGTNNLLYNYPYNIDSKQYIFSLYSGVNSNSLTKQTCLNSSGVWGDCLNKICVVNPNNPNKATCRCSPQKSNNWITFKDKKNSKPCSCNKLSGSTNTMYNYINSYYNNMNNYYSSIK